MTTFIVHLGKKIPAHIWQPPFFVDNNRILAESKAEEMAEYVVTNLGGEAPRIGEWEAFVPRIYPHDLWRAHVTFTNPPDGRTWGFYVWIAKEDTP